MSGKIFEIGKWVLIGVLSVLLIVLFKSNHDLESSFKSYKKDGTLMITSQSQTIGQLKKSNRELYDSIKNIADVKQAAIIKYRYVYNGDTVYVNREVPIVSQKDSLYAFERKSDSISYKLNVKGTNIAWYKLNFTINDKLMLVNREKDGHNETSISTNGGQIVDANFFNKKDNRDDFINRFSVGPSLGLGYGLISKKPDVYAGISITFRLNKLKN